jgi:hypothetical protein
MPSGSADPAGTGGATPRRKWVIPTLTVVFLAVFYLLVFNGGQCERYDRKMNRMQRMRHYYDSIRREEQLRKIR